MDVERVLTDQTVLVEEGRITALGPAERTRVPVGAVRIEGRGKYLIPGLADMHAHLFMYFETEPQIVRHLFDYVANGVTTVRNTDAIPEEHAEAYMRFKATGVVSPHLYVAAPMGSWLIDSATPSAVAAHVTATYESGAYNFINVPPALFLTRRPVFDSLLATARRLNLTVSLHQNETTWEQMLALGSVGGSVEHVYMFWKPQPLPSGDRPQFVPQDRTRPLIDTSSTGLQALATTMRRAGSWITPTMVCMKDRPDTRRLLQALQAAGVGLLLGADADGSGGRTSPSIVHDELEEMIRVGLTPYQALRTGTYNVAQYLRVLDSSGTVAVGKRADLVLLRGNPLHDIQYTRDPAGVMIGGQWFDRAMLDERLLAIPKTP
jgi:imidazolonepropionase-like amidohydrolase